MQIKRNIFETTEERGLRWYGHLERIVEKRLPRKVLNWKMEEKK